MKGTRGGGIAGVNYGAIISNVTNEAEVLLLVRWEKLAGLLITEIWKILLIKVLSLLQEVVLAARLHTAVILAER